MMSSLDSHLLQCSQLEILNTVLLAYLRYVHHECPSVLLPEEKQVRQAERKDIMNSPKSLILRSIWSKTSIQEGLKHDKSMQDWSCSA